MESSYIFYLLSTSIFAALMVYVHYLTEKVKELQYKNKMIARRKDEVILDMKIHIEDLQYNLDKTNELYKPFKLLE